MKVFVFGALLVQTLVAQVTDDASATSDGLAPLLTPASDAPAEADLLGTPTDAAIEDLGTEATIEADANATASSNAEIEAFDFLPTGTEDVVLDASPTESTDPTITDDTFGGGESAVDGVVFDGSEFNFPTPVLAPETTPIPLIAVGEPVQNDFVDFESVSSDDLGLGLDASTAEDSFEVATATEDFGLGTPATASATDAASVAESDAIDFATLSEAIIEPTDIQTAFDAFETATDPVFFPDFGATASAEAGFGAAQATGDVTSVDDEAVDNGIAIAPEQTDVPTVDIFEDPTQPEVVESSSTFDLSPTGVDAVPEPDVTLGSDSDISAAAAGEFGAANAEYDSPGAWTSEDDSEYDGQDYGYEFDDSECPAYCLEEGYGADDSVAPYEAEASDATSEDAEEDDSEEEVPLVKRMINWLRPRQAPSSDGGFAAFSWPGAQSKKDTDECTKDVPEWLYESSGKKHKLCKAIRPKCPASCYSTTPSESTGGYNTRPWTMPYPASSPASTPDALPTGGYDTTAYYDSTATETQTTFVTSTTTAATGYYDDSGKDYTGSTLDTVCPKQCNPFDPAANKCDMTSSCTTTGNGKYYCACRAGFRAGAWNEKDFSKQFKFASQPYVYTAEGVVCDKVCSDQTCSEVLLRPQCQ
ncbi:hypothetical protein BDU57DRAFT_119647 [Ampelomyces quisqualis]|uniref:EGF-like domain-containing protein n=1 Tax=Ampelomyces quisqualis TaxID=50730 RepID=A0A6A5QVA3_AMPQU|nr:hypothetical protein BDU57DRAFT_119647 [Ampelomyces quisqualis]